MFLIPNAISNIACSSHFSQDLSDPNSSRIFLARFYMYWYGPCDHFQETNKCERKKGNQGRVFAILLLSSPLFRDLPFPLYASSPSEMLHLLPSKTLTPPDLIVRHLAGTQSTSLHRRRWRRLLGPRRRRWWWRLLPRRPVTVRVLRPAGRAPVTITVPVASVAHLAVCVLEYIRAVAAIF